jgi:MFS family permease
MTAPVPSEQTRRKVPGQAWWALAVLSYFYVLSFMDRYILTMLVDPIQADLGINDFEMGLILGPAFGLVLGIFAVPFGLLADRKSRRTIVASAVGFWSAATMACGLANSFAALFLARVGVGAGEAAISPAATSLLADKFPRERLTTAVAIYSSGSKLGSASAYGFGGILLGLLGGTALSVPLLGDVEPWQMVFILVGLPGALSALLVYTFSEPLRRGRKSAEPPRPGLLLEFLKSHRRLLIPMYGGFALITLCGNALLAWVPTFVSRHYGMDPAHFGPALGIVSFIAAPVLVLKGVIVDWIYSRGGKDAHLRFYSWLLFGTTPVAMVVFFMPDPWMFFALYGILLVITIPSMMYLQACLALLAPNELRGQLTGVGYTIYSILGVGGGPTIIGALTNFLFHDEAKVGWSLALVLSTGIPAGAVLLRMSMKPLRAAVAEAEALEQRDAIGL